jgi:FHA domain
MSTHVSSRSRTRSPVREGSGQLALGVVLEKRALTYPLPATGRVVIGRDPAADFSIEHPSLSRRHAELELGAQLILDDLGSKNGTWIDGAALTPGTRVRLDVPTTVVLGSVSMAVVRCEGRGLERGLWPEIAFMTRLEYECHRAQRTGRALALLRMRVDEPLDPAAQLLLVRALGEGRPLVIEGERDYLVLAHGEIEAQALAMRAAAALAPVERHVDHRIACLPRDARSPGDLLAYSKASWR